MKNRFIAMATGDSIKAVKINVIFSATICIILLLVVGYVTYGGIRNFGFFPVLVSLCLISVIGHCRKKLTELKQKRRLKKLRRPVFIADKRCGLLKKNAASQ